MAIATQDLQRMCDDAWDNAQDGANTFRPELRANERAVGDLISKGSLASVSKNSASQSYAFGSYGSLTTAEIARGWRDLINLFDLCQQILIDAGTATPTDDQIRTQMLARLKPVYSRRPDLTLLRQEVIP